MTEQAPEHPAPWFPSGETGPLGEDVGNPEFDPEPEATPEDVAPHPEEG